MRTAFNIFYGVFLGFLVVSGALFLVSMAPFETGVETKIVQSGSMEPVIPIGALVVIKPKAAYEVGDIITFGEDSASAAPTTHRIVSVREESGIEFYTTKGDANEEADPREVARGDVIGKVYLSVPYAGFVFNFARQPVGFALLIGFPTFLVIVAELVAIVQEVVRMRRGRRSAPAAAKRAHASAHLRRAHRPAPSIEYVRRFAMDEIFVPERIFDTRVRRIPVYHYGATLSSTLAVLCIVLVASFGNAGGTLSYFRDTELSIGNTFGAGTWPSGAQLIQGFAVGEGETGSEDVSQPIEEVVENVDESETDDENAALDEEGALEGEEATREREGREDREAREEGRGNSGEREERNAGSQEPEIVDVPSESAPSAEEPVETSSEDETES